MVCFYCFHLNYHFFFIFIVLSFFFFFNVFSFQNHISNSWGKMFPLNHQKPNSSDSRHSFILFLDQITVLVIISLWCVCMWCTQASEPTQAMTKPPGTITGGIPEVPAGAVWTHAGVIWFSWYYWILKTQYVVYGVLPVKCQRLAGHLHLGGSHWPALMYRKWIYQKQVG